MSTKFDWSQFEVAEPAQSQSQGFDWSQFEIGEEERPEFKIGFKPSGPSRIPEMKRQATRDLTTVGTTIAGIPGDIASGVGSALNWIKEQLPFGTPKSEEELKEITENPLTHEKLREKAAEFIPSIAPQTPEEKEWDENLSLLTSLLIPLPTGKTKALDPRTATKVYKAGKSLGLKVEELTPLIQGQRKQRFLGKIAKKTEGLKNALEMTQGALSDVYTGIKERASVLPKISNELTENLIDKFVKIKSDLQKTIQPSPDKKGAISFIDGAIERLNNFGSSPEEIINGIQDVNRAVNWNAIKGGKKVLASLKEPMEEALFKSAPEIANEYKKANLLWRQMKDFEKNVGVSGIAEWIEQGKVPAMVYGFLSGNVEKVIKGAAQIMAARHIATRLLTDPKWQNLHGKLMTAVKNNSVSTATKLFQILKGKVEEEMPEEYEQIDWTQF